MGIRISGVDSDSASTSQRMTGQASLREHLETLDGMRPQRPTVSSGNDCGKILEAKENPRVSLASEATFPPVPRGRWRDAELLAASEG